MTQRYVQFWLFIKESGTSCLIKIIKLSAIFIAREKTHYLLISSPGKIWERVNRHGYATLIFSNFNLEILALSLNI